MTAGVGGTPGKPLGYVPPDQPGVAAGNPATLRARQVIIAGPSGQLLVYSPTAAAGNLINSIAGAAGTDPYGNHFVQGTATYAASFAAALIAGAVQFYSGSLAGGWTARGSVQTNSLGDILILQQAGRTVITNNNTLDDGAGNMTVAGTLTVGGSTNTGQSPNTGFFNTQGLASGSYGSTHQHTLPNFTTATHVHPL